MGRWEYHQEVIDFRRETLPGSSKPISSKRFWYRNFAGNNNQVEVKYRAWNLISPVIQQHVDALGAQGWELTSPLDPSIVRTTQGAVMSEGFFFVLCFLLLPVAIIILIIAMIFGSDYFVYQSIRLPFRRYIP